MSGAIRTPPAVDDGAARPDAVAEADVEADVEAASVLTTVLVPEAPDHGQQLVLALTIALGVHALIVLGLQFRNLLAPAPAPVYSLNVSLIEQSSGDLDAAAQRGSPPAEPVPPPAPPLAQPAEPLPDLSTDTLISTTAVQPDTAPQTNEPQPDEPRELENSVAEPAQAIPAEPPAASPPAAPLQAALGENSGRDSAPSPRAAEAADADSGRLEGQYAERWRRTVERSATENFPEKISRAGLTGRLTLDVAIRADGSVESITLLRSSGYPELDRAARQMVYLAAPFEPFPEPLRRRREIIHVVRTWEFDQRSSRLRSAETPASAAGGG